MVGIEEVSIDRHMDWCIERGLAEHTLDQRHRILVGIETYCAAGPLAAAMASDLRRWWSYQARRKISVCGHAARRPSLETRRTYLAHLRSYYRWVTARGYRSDDPSAVLPVPRRVRALPRDVDPVAVEAALRQMETLSVPWWCVTLAYRLGLRCCEIATTRTTDVLTRAAGPVLRVVGKGGHERVLPLPADVLAALRQMPSGWLLPSTRSAVGHLHPDSVSNATSHALTRAGLPNVTAHQLRHTFATALLAVTGDIAAVREALGHADYSSTAIYARSQGISPAAIRDLYHSREEL